jgi:hypothetical protein
MMQIESAEEFIGFATIILLINHVQAEKSFKFKHTPTYYKLLLYLCQARRLAHFVPGRLSHISPLPTKRHRLE